VGGKKKKNLAAVERLPDRREVDSILLGRLAEEKKKGGPLTGLNDPDFDAKCSPKSKGEHKNTQKRGIVLGHGGSTL